MEQQIEKVAVKVKVNTKQNPPELVYVFLEDLAEERLNKAFDILFEEGIKTVKGR